MDLKSIDRQTLQVTVVCSSLLLLKCYFTNFIIGGKRAKAGSRPPEDQVIFSNVNQGFPTVKVESVEDQDNLMLQEARESEQRWLRIGLND